MESPTFADDNSIMPQWFNPSPHTPILGSSRSAANKDMIATLWTNGDTIICLSRKHCGKRRNCSLRAISPFFHNVFKSSLLLTC